MRDVPEQRGQRGKQHPARQKTHQRAIDADILQIAPNTEFDLLSHRRCIPIRHHAGDEI